MNYSVHFDHGVLVAGDFEKEIQVVDESDFASTLFPHEQKIALESLNWNSVLV